MSRTILRSCRLWSGGDVEHPPATDALHAEPRARRGFGGEAVAERAADLDEWRAHCRAHLKHKPSEGAGRSHCGQRRKAPGTE